MKPTEKRRSTERLHKVLARSGVASKRACEDLIRQGRISVDGAVVRDMGVQVDPNSQEIRFDGERIKMEQPAYFVVYKPRRVLCTTEDTHGRRTVLSYVRDAQQRRLFIVGRLDQDAEGLVLVTNDGTFANDLLKAHRQLPRTYFVKARGQVTQEALDQVRAGLWLSDGRTPPMEVIAGRSGGQVSTFWCRVVERHHHELRRVWAKVGFPVQRLVLVKIGPVGTDGLKKGSARILTTEEVRQLREGGNDGALPKLAPVQRPTAAPRRRGPPAAMVAPAEPASRSGRVRPAAARSGAARPGAARPGAARPGAARPGAARPGAARPGAARPGVDRDASAGGWGRPARLASKGRGAKKPGSGGRPEPKTGRAGRPGKTIRTPKAR